MKSNLLPAGCFLTIAAMSSPPPKPPPLPISPRVLSAILVGLLLTFATIVLAVRWVAGDSTPRFDFAAHQSALSRWEATGPKNYDLEIHVTGSQPATYLVEVRGGEPRAAFRNQAPLKQRRIFSTWSVDGMFGTLAEDVNRWQGAKTKGGKLPFDLRVAYDPIYGYPARYHRRETGSTVEVEWRVSRFEVIPSPAESRLPQEPERE